MTWLMAAKYKRKWAGCYQNKLFRQIYQLAPSHNTSLWNYNHLPSALENGLQQSTIWTGWQGGPVLEENTLEPNSNRFDPSNSHLLCCSGPGRRTQPLPAILFWASVNMLVFHFLITRTAQRKGLGEEREASLNTTNSMRSDLCAEVY